MRPILALFLVLTVSLLLQTALISRINLLNGSADLILVVLAAWSLQERVRYSWAWGLAAGIAVGSVSTLPWFLYLAAYLATIGLARLLTRRIWQAPLLAMFAVTFTGTLLVLVSAYLYRTLFEQPLAFGESFIQVILPSMMLNLLLAVAIHPLVRDLAGWVFPAPVLEA